jgi:hypothetical protein
MFSLLVTQSQKASSYVLELDENYLPTEGKLETTISNSPTQLFSGECCPIMVDTTIDFTGPERNYSVFSTETVNVLSSPGKGLS